MFIDKNIKYFRTKNNLTLKEIAEMLGYKSLTTVQKWEAGIAQPPLKTVRQLADFFHVDIDDFTNTDMQHEEIKKDNFVKNMEEKKIAQIAKVLRVSPSYLMGWEEKKKNVKIPVYGKVAAGTPFDAIEDIIDYEEIPEAMANSGEYFCLHIKGDSMTPFIEDGDVVVVKRQANAENGDTVIALVDGHDACCKRFRRYADGTIELISNNPSYGSIVFNEDHSDLEILGKVVELRRKF